MEEPPPPMEEFPSQTRVAEPEPKPIPVMVKKPSESMAPKETPSIFKKKKVEVEEGVASTVEKKEVEFAEVELKAAWKNFRESRENPGDTEKLILGREVKKGEEHQVLIFLSSQLEVSFLEKFETDLIRYLRTELENDHLTINKQVAQIEESKKLYTSKDIYDYMVKQNPKLKDLKEKLGLDFDY